VQLSARATGAGVGAGGRVPRPASARLLAALLAPLLAVLLAGAAAAQDPAGHVHTINGRASAASPEGAIRLIPKGAPVFPGDTVSTGPNTYLRLRFTDGSFTVLRPNTRFKIDEYQHGGEPEEEKGFFSLLKGGFRAVTGLIAETRRENYRVETAVATIGIRGTDFEARLCSGDCSHLGLPDGLYAGVGVGGITITNNVHTSTWAAGRFLYVAGLDVSALPLAFRPPALGDIPSPDPQLCP